MQFFFYWLSPTKGNSCTDTYCPPFSLRKMCNKKLNLRFYTVKPGTFFDISRICFICSSDVSWKKQEYVGDDVKICLQETLKSVDWIDWAQDVLLF
jgi:hypothetical protein